MLPDDQLFQNFCGYMFEQWGNNNISVHGQAVRTNNSVESFHKYFFATVGRAHPNVWTFLTKIVQVDQSKAAQLLRRQNGEESIPRIRGQNLKRNAIIKKQQEQLEIDGNIDKFLTGLIRTTSQLIAYFDVESGNYPI